MDEQAEKKIYISDTMDERCAQIVRDLLHEIPSPSPSEMFKVQTSREPMVYMPYNQLNSSIWIMADRLLKERDSQP